MDNKKFISESNRMRTLMGLDPLEEGKKLEVFPVGGGKYNIGYDDDWDDFSDPIGTANSDFSSKPTGSGVDGHPKGHHGIDIFGPRGAAIYAPVDGVVKIDKNNGNTVIIQDKDGYSHWLGHLETITTDEGVLVKAGTKVGTLGNTGNAEKTAPHLHYNVYKTDDGFYSASSPLDNLKDAIGKEADDEFEIGDETPEDFLSKLEKAYDDFVDDLTGDNKEGDEKPEEAKADSEEDMFDILLTKGKEFISKLLG